MAKNGSGGTIFDAIIFEKTICHILKKIYKKNLQSISEIPGHAHFPCASNPHLVVFGFVRPFGALFAACFGHGC